LAVGAASAAEFNTNDIPKLKTSRQKKFGFLIIRILLLIIELHFILGFTGRRAARKPVGIKAPLVVSGFIAKDVP
jgi:hypothetical protein